MSKLKNFIDECKNDWEKQPEKSVARAINSNVSKYMYELELFEKRANKEHELLELYRKVLSSVELTYKPNQYVDVIRTINEIKALEKELKDGI